MILSKKNIFNFASVLILSCFVSFTYGQRDSVQTLTKRIDQYYKNTLEEKIYIHTDRSFYLTGETIWFKIYNVDASLHKPLAVSKVAYIDIVDKDKNPILQKKIAIDKTGSGSIFLPASISSGNYQLRAYTNWMKNFSADLYFHQSITIVNPFVKLDLKSTEKTTTDYDVQFFPEGGNLVYGLQSKVAFRAVDPTGHGFEFNGTIIDENNNTLASFNPHKFGIGNFLLTPISGHQYRAAITNKEGQTIIYNLPPIQDNGLVLHVSDTAENWIIASVKSNYGDRQNLHPVYLLMHTKQNVISCEMHLLQAGTTSFIIEKKKINDGISHITLFNEKLEPICDRLYYKKPEHKISLQVQTELNQYAVRKKVKVDINAKFIDDKTSLINLSASVYKNDVLQSDYVNIEEYLYLTSELSGKIESPSYYLSDSTSIEKSIAIDNLMLTHGWSRFAWKNVLAGNRQYEYIPEIRSHIISGKITETTTGSPVKNIVTYLASPDKNIRLYLSKSNDEGKIEFETLNFYGNKDITVTTNLRQDSTYSIQLTNPFSDKYSSYKPSALDLSESLKTDLEQRAIQMQVQNIFFEKELSKFKEVSKDSSAFYGEPDKRYFLDDYTRFPVMEEVMREYVAEVMVRKRGKKFHFYNWDTPHNAVFNEEPLILIDGVPVFDTDKIIAFDPRKIKRLDVMTRTYFLGALSFPGIVSYSTYNGDLGGFQLNPKTLIQNYEGLQYEREFFSPIYETQQAKANTLPDARNLLHWAPTIITDKDGRAHFEFYTSDVSGKFNIVIQGISNDGKPGFSTSSFEVKDKLNY
jgi:hypothetical protein